MTSNNTEIRVALPQLVDLAVAVREDWTAADVKGAMVNAYNHGFTWSQALVAMVRLMVDGQARPGEIVPERHNPVIAARSANPVGADIPAEVTGMLAEALKSCQEATAKHKAAARGDAS